MFKALFSRLTGRATPAPDPELDAQFAIVALLVRLAKADAHYAFEEIAEIDRIVAGTWDLNPVEAMKMRARAEQIEAEAPATAELSQLVRDHTAYAQRGALFDALWDVSLADRKLRRDERRFLDRAADALGIDAGDAAAAAARYGEAAPVDGDGSA